MTTGKQINGWTLAIILSVAIIAFGSVVIWSKYGRSQPIEITIVSPQELQGEIYIDGVVNNPGFYPLRTGDSLEDVIQAAGGVSDSADLTQLKLYISEGNGEKLAQRININLAEAWLLQALPGIGETRAQAIIDYRQQNDQFLNINELLKVEGIGTSTYEKIKHLITVAD